MNSQVAVTVLVYHLCHTIRQTKQLLFGEYQYQNKLVDQHNTNGTNALYPISIEARVVHKYKNRESRKRKHATEFPNPYS